MFTVCVCCFFGLAGCVCALWGCIAHVSHCVLVCVCVGDRSQSGESESSLAHAAPGLSVPCSLLCTPFSSSFPLISFSSSPSEASDKASLCSRSRRCVFRRGNVSADALRANSEFLERVFFQSDSCVFRAHSGPQFYTLKHGFDSTCFSLFARDCVGGSSTRQKRGGM